VPDLFILGAPKCGTTSLANWLQEHPRVFIPEVKEPQRFNTDFEIPTQFRDHREYLALFAGAGPAHLRLGEATPWYLFSETAVPNILAHQPDPRFVVMLRNPADMAPSLHRQLLFSGIESETSFARAWALQAARRHGRQLPMFCRDPKELLYADACALGTQMTRLLTHIPDSCVHTILLDELRGDAASVWRDLQAFLGLPDDGRTVFPVLNPAKQRRSQVAQTATNAYRAMRQKLHLPPLGTGFFTRLQRWNVQALDARAPDPEMREELVSYFRPEVKRLEALLKRDLSAWKSV
jgi:hypothetical protein